MKKEIKCVWTIASECGPIREKNEDSVFPSVSGSTTEVFYAAVCDGLGGHKGGNIASKLAIEQIQDGGEDLTKILIILYLLEFLKSVSLFSQLYWSFLLKIQPH